MDDLSTLDTSLESLPEVIDGHSDASDTSMLQQNNLDTRTGIALQLNTPPSSRSPSTCSNSMGEQPCPDSRLFCPVPGCKNTSGFRQAKELKRHQKKHNSASTQWYCGCCLNSGVVFEGLYRKDKLQDHMRKIHKISGSIRDGYNKECKECPCSENVLFATENCVAEHSAQKHPHSMILPVELGVDAHIDNIPRSTDRPNAHDCRREAAAKRLPQAKRLADKKRELIPVMQSTAKRAKFDVNNDDPTSQVGERLLNDSIYTPSQPALSSFGLDFAINDAAFEGSTIGTVEPMIGQLPGSLSPGNLPFGDQSFYSELFAMPVTTISTATRNPYADTIFRAPYIPHFEKIDINGIHPMDFLAIYCFQEFRNIESALKQLASAVPYHYTSPITYAARRRTIVLEGYASDIHAAAKSLKNLGEIYSKNCGSEYLNQCDAGCLDYSALRGSSSDKPYAKRIEGKDHARVYALSPKTNRNVITLWMKSILPAIDGILSERLGKTHNASIVRRGQTELEAEPCILVESPKIPDPYTQESIQNAVSELCCENKHPLIPVEFLKGAFQKLNGGREANSEYTRTEEPHIKFNFNRPCSKPGMGASLGLLRSGRVSATLGGYIVISGETYILTSDHFVSKAQEEDNSEDYPKITSPSRPDLVEMSECLKQTIRDIRTKVDLTVTPKYGNQPTEGSEMYSSESSSYEEAQNAIDGVKGRLEQVNKGHENFVLGEVFRRATEEPRVAVSTLGVPLSHRMDWAICKVNNRVGENRHKYRSNEDAMADNYIFEEDRAKNPGELCLETCEISPGFGVYYCGQKSGLRRGIVSAAPISTSTQTSIGTIKSQEWAIVAEGGSVQLASVEGDSGAWVIRQQDHKLMGQVVAHATGQVLFTPIKTLFEDIRHHLCLSVDVCLPRPVGHCSSSLTVTAPATQLCAIQEEPKVHTYGWLEPEALRDSSLDPHLAVYDSACSVTDSPQSRRLKEIDDERDDDNVTGTSNSERQSLSPVPSLPGSPSTVKAELGAPEERCLSDSVEPPEGPWKDAKVLGAHKGPISEIADDSEGLSQHTPVEDSFVELPETKVPKFASSHNTHSPFNSTFQLTTSRSATWPTVKDKATQTRQGRGSWSSASINVHTHLLNRKVFLKSGNSILCLIIRGNPQTNELAELHTFTTKQIRHPTILLSKRGTYPTLIFASPLAR